jgi:hypothetical protein
MLQENCGATLPLPIQTNHPRNNAHHFSMVFLGHLNAAELNGMAVSVLDGRIRLSQNVHLLGRRFRS